MKRESKGNVAAEIKINFFIFIHHLHSTKKMELCFTHCRIGTQKSEKKPAGKNSDSGFCNIWAISGFLITFTDFPRTHKSIKFKSLKILWI